MPPDIDYATARNLMVDGQVRPNKVTNPRIIEAMRVLPRERFVPAGAKSLAYADEDVPLGGERVLMEPMLIARLLQIADMLAGERVLVLGAGCGYGAALAAACGAIVVALESDAELGARTQVLLGELAPSVTVMVGPLAAGCPAQAPFDVVLVDGAFEELPPAVLSQLRRPGGRLVGIQVGAGRTSQGVLGEVAGPAGHDAVALRPVFDAASPALPELRRAAAFVF